MHAGCFIVWWAVQRYEYVRVRTLSVPARPTVIRLITACTPQHNLASRWLPAGHRGSSPVAPPSRVPRGLRPGLTPGSVSGSHVPLSRATPWSPYRVPPCLRPELHRPPIPELPPAHPSGAIPCPPSGAPTPPRRGSRVPRLELRRAPASRAHPWLRSGLPRAPVPSSPVVPRPGLPRCRGLPRPFSLVLLRT